MPYTLRDRPELHGTIVEVEAIYSTTGDPDEPVYMRLIYSDGRKVVFSPTGYEAEGLYIECNAGWFDTRLREYRIVKVHA